MGPVGPNKKALLFLFTFIYTLSRGVAALIPNQKMLIISRLFLIISFFSLFFFAYHFDHTSLYKL